MEIAWLVKGKVGRKKGWNVSYHSCISWPSWMASCETSAKTLVSEPLPSSGKPHKNGRTANRRPPRRDQRVENRQKQPYLFSTLATAATTGNQSSPTAKTCMAFDEKHSIAKYEKFLTMDVNQRAQSGKEKKLIFCCFGSTDHPSRDCTRKKDATCKVVTNTTTRSSTAQHQFSLERHL